MQQQLQTTSQLLDYSRATAHVHATQSQPQPPHQPSIDDLTADFGNMKVNFMQHQPLPDPRSTNHRSSRRDNNHSPSRSPSRDRCRSRDDSRSRYRPASPGRRRDRDSGDYPSRPRNNGNNRQGRGRRPNNFNSNRNNFQPRQPNNRNNSFNGRRPYNNAPGYFVPFNQLPFPMPFVSTHPMASYPLNNMPSMQPPNQSYPRYNQHWKQLGQVDKLAPVPFSPMPDIPWPTQPALEYPTSTTSPRN